MPKKQTKKPVKSAAVKLPKVTVSLPPVVTKYASKVYCPVVTRVKDLQKRRPHRSFRLTQRSDYKRSFALPGYWAFTNQVRALLWKNWRLFGGLVLVYMAATIIISGFGAQQSYNTLTQSIRDGSGDLFKGNFGAVGQSALTLLSVVTVGLSPNLSQAQSILGGLALFFAWLATIWLLRNTLAGHNPRLRDGLYNSGSPVLATVAVGFIITLQLLPAATAIILYSAAQGSGLLDGGASAMLAWCGIFLLPLLSVYWVTSSFIALVIVTLPGMYPMHAIRSAGDLVVGRRLRVLYRMSWLLLIVSLTWAIIVIPIIQFNEWLKSVTPVANQLPIVPLVVIGMSSLTLIYVTSYIYLLYRRIVDDDAAPA